MRSSFLQVQRSEAGKVLEDSIDNVRDSMTSHCQGTCHACLTERNDVMPTVCIVLDVVVSPPVPDGSAPGLHKCIYHV